MLLKVGFIFIFGLFLSACASTDLIQQSEYNYTRTYLKQSEPGKALAEFPKKEVGGFITTVEKGYLDLLAGKASPKTLLPVSDDVEKRKVTYVSKEMEYFYKETEEGYFPAEHEVIFLHLLTGLSFAQIGDAKSARVEAMKAAFYLQGHFAEHQGDFDDPSLRLLLASLWLYCDEWEHARVDLRVAAKLSKEFSWAAKVAEQTNPPKQMFVVLAGIGPEPKWRPSTGSQYLTGYESLRFDLSFEERNLSITDNKSNFPLISRDATANWYDRHQKRNTDLRDILQGSKYMAKATGALGLAATEHSATTIFASSVFAVGTLLAVAIAAPVLYLASETGSSELIGYGLVAALGVFSKFSHDAGDIFQSGTKSANKRLEENLETASTYRFVRFLPDYVYAGISKNIFNSPRLNPGTEMEFRNPFMNLTSDKNKTRLDFFFLPY